MIVRRAPGNVGLDEFEGGLSNPAVVNVSQLVTIDAGLRLVLSL